MIRQFEIGQKFYTVEEDSQYYDSIAITTITISENGTIYSFGTRFNLTENALNERIDNGRIFFNEVDAIRKNIQYLEDEAKKFNQEIRKKILDRKMQIRNLTLKKK